MVDTPTDTPNPFLTDAHTLATMLSDMHIASIRANPEKLGGDIIADKLKQLRDAVWVEPKASTTVQSDNQDIFKLVMKDLDDPVQRTQLLTAYAHMGHLNEIANLAAREGYFTQLRNNNELVPGGVKAFIAEQEKQAQAQGGITAADLVEKLNQPVFEAVLTAHPTNVNSLKSIQAQRQIALELNGLMHGESNTTKEGLQKAIEAYAKEPILNHGEDGKDKNFTVRDETKMMINALANIYDDLPRIYKEYDEALTAKGGYDHQALNLKLHLKSWGSAGDKDGNNNVTAEKTLEAIALHTDAILERYLKDLEGLKHDALNASKGMLEKAHTALHETLLPALKQLNDDGDAARANKGKFNPKELEQRFNDLSGQLAVLREGLKLGEFQDGLKTVYEKGNEQEKQKALELLRKTRTFGFEFAKIEYRETAKEYERVVGEIIGDEYKNAATAADRQKILDNICKDEQGAADLYKAAKDRIIAGATRPYEKEEKKNGVLINPEGALPIAYHTIKRMELARDHPAMFEDNVLAECGSVPKESKSFESDIKVQGAVNFLEAQFVQQAAAQGKKRPLLGIVPLFEEPDTMSRIQDIMRGAYKDEAYKEHQQRVADKYHGGKLTQQVQIAQSDNARRAGIPAARAFIHEANKKLKDLNDEFKIEGQSYVGGSISDAYRNGVRALSATVNAFSMHKFAKFTFQGGDMLNYFNAPFSNTRLFTRQFVHLAGKLKKTPGGWEVDQSSVQSNGETNQYNSVADTVAITALKDALDDYRKKDFNPEGLGTLLTALDYNRETAAGNVGSRAGTRDKASSAAPTEAEKFEPTNLETLRTIGFSEAMQHNDLLPSWVGAQHLGQHLKTYLDMAVSRLQRRPFDKAFSNEERDFFSPSKWVEKEVELTPEVLNGLYKLSPTFRDAMDKCAYGVALTDMDRLSRRIDSIIAKLPEPKDAVTKEKAKTFKEDLETYKSRLRKAYQRTGAMAFAAITGKEFKPDDFHPKNNNPTITRYDTLNAKIAAAATKALDKQLSLAPDIHRKMQYRAFGMFLKEHEDKLKQPLDLHEDKVLHAALDTVVHGRMPKADDTSYGKALRANKQAKYVPDFGDRKLASWEL